MAVIIRDCSHCGAGHSTLTLIATAMHPADGRLYRVLLACNRCHGPFVALTEATDRFRGDNKDPGKVAGDVESAGTHIRLLHPTRPAAKAPDHTPQQIANRFIEAEDSFRRQKWTSAVGMYRSTLDIATKDVVTKALPTAAGKKLASRIEALAGAHIITDAMKDWAHQVRGAGNDALHDEEDMTEADAVQMRLFTETFLRYTYELPGEVDARKAQTKAP